MHFVHQRSEILDAIPLLFLHGWPSSFLEISKTLPLLVKESDGGRAFHVVAPSLIDFGFSGGNVKVCLLHSIFPLFTSRKLADRLTIVIVCRKIFI